jgi:drug/metabolite transporter (DMT)-like permease
LSRTPRSAILRAIMLSGFSQGLRFMAGAAFFFSLMSLFVRLAGEGGMPTMQVVLARSVVVLVIAWSLLRRQGTSPWGHSRGLLLLRGVVGFISLACFYFALIHLPLAEATVIQYTNPVWTALLAALLLAERIGWKEMAVSLASLAGVVIMARPDFLFGAGVTSLPALPVAAGVFGAMVSGLAYVIVRRVARSEAPLVIVFWFALVSLVGSVPFVVVDPVLPSLPVLVVLLGVGVTTYLGQILITLGLQRERAGRAMAVAYLQVAFAALWGLMLLGEQPDRWTALGATVILGCTWMLGRMGRASQVL